MRLDKFLKVSRLIKRRTVANEACSAGRVLVNGKAGDRIDIQFGNRETAVEVVSIAETVKKDEAADLYKFL
jgi:ribosomal 50S subunit-recycling heat shock protein